MVRYDQNSNKHHTLSCGAFKKETLIRGWHLFLEVHVLLEYMWYAYMFSYSKDFPQIDLDLPQGNLHQN